MPVNIVHEISHCKYCMVSYKMMMNLLCNHVNRSNQFLWTKKNWLLYCKVIKWWSTCYTKM